MIAKVCLDEEYNDHTLSWVSSEVNLQAARLLQCEVPAFKVRTWELKPQNPG
jgi:hypothetical protein